MSNPMPKTPQQKPSQQGPARGVFGYDVSRVPKWMFWREMSQTSLLIFAGSVGVAAIVFAHFMHWIDWRGHLKFRRDVKPAEVVVTPPVEEPAEPAKRRRAVDGVAIDETVPTGGRYYALMIDNLNVARPQSGLSKASVVYEVPVEGGITRFMAVFADDTVAEKIGPVRSARPYFLDWAAEYDAQYGHVGGSPEALDILAKGEMRDLNQFFNGPYFWRDLKRAAPHNVYTSTELLGKAFDKRWPNDEVRPLEPWTFKDDAPEEERPEAHKIFIDYGGSYVNVTWTYDRATNAWTRKQGVVAGGSLDGGQPITAKTIIVQEAEVAVIDNYGRRRIDTIASGDATVFVDGRAVHGTWKKESRDGRTRFFDASRNEIELNAGAIWVEVVPKGTPVTETPAAE